jgi:hypothetical protein
MPIYLCREGHKQRSQEAATNCGYCKRNHRKSVESPKSNFYPLMLELRHIKTKRDLNKFCKKVNATDNLSVNEVDVLRQYVEDAYENQFNISSPTKLVVSQKALDYIRKRADSVILVKLPRKK